MSGVIPGEKIDSALRLKTNLSNSSYSVTHTYSIIVLISYELDILYNICFRYQKLF